MDCAEFEVLLFDALEREPTPSDVERMRVHLLTCADCRQLDSVLRGDEQRSVTELPHDFARAVVSRTSGRPCEQARMLLTAPEDSRSDDDWLVARHLETCPDCSAVAAALARLRRELPKLSEADPGEDFVHSVIAATSGAPSEPKRRPGARLQRHVERLIRRPRIALEGAYAIAMAVLMVAGLSSLSFNDLPSRADTAVWRPVADMMRTVATGVAELQSHALVRADRMVKSASADVVELGSAFSTSAREFASNAWDGLVTQNVQEMRSLWNENVSGTVEPDKRN